MNNLLKYFLLSLVVLVNTNVYSQKIKVVTGNLDFLKDQKVLNIEYSYENMGVGRYDLEEDYVNEKVIGYNDKEPGKGDEWLKNWMMAKEKIFGPTFKGSLNDVLKDVEISIDEDPKTMYTIVLKTTFIEPGFDVGVMSKKANAKYEVIFVNNEDNKVVAALNIFAFLEAGGIGYDFNTINRIQKVYAKAGNGLGQYLIKKAF
jgi:hypothetical protein